jgi:hypothetical protein
LKISLFRKTLVLGLVFLFVGAGFLPIIYGNSGLLDDFDEAEHQKIMSIIDESVLDIQYIYNITKALSYIIFTEYDEEAGELAKGRAFGTKGEHKAAEILYENMSKLGLYTTLEQIHNIPDHPSCFDLTNCYQSLDYGLKITNTTSRIEEDVDCQIRVINVKTPQHEQVNYYEYKGLNVKKRPTKPVEWIKAIVEDKKEGGYVFLEEYGYSGFSRDPNETFPLGVRILHKFVYPINRIILKRLKYVRYFDRGLLKNCFPNCKGVIIYDFTDETHNTYENVHGQEFPIILINGSVGQRIAQDTESFTVDFYSKQMYNESVICYNVIGQLNGTDPSKTVLVDCLYDSVWCQGTGDSAIGMAVVMGIAKYFTDNNITPKYNINFIGFGGEEAGCRGARYYEVTHKDEKIIYVIDFNQIGFEQRYPRQTLNLICNNYGFMKELSKVAERTNYVERNGDTRDIAMRYWREGAPSDDHTFGKNRKNCKTVCFLTDFPWREHHRDGLNHTEGDVLKYFDWMYTSLAGEIALNVTMHLTVEGAI